MESDGEVLENIFEENESEAEAENKTANETPGAVKIAAPKRVVKNPRLKFNADRLCGERGIPILVDHFKNVKFKGPGHEKEDLDKLLAKLEHWTHRLFPSMKFEDCLTHIEKLGRKRQVQTCLRKIRLDMPILSSDFVKDDEDDDVKRNEDFEPEEINAFDRLLGERESEEISSIDASTSGSVTNSSSFCSSLMPNDTVGHVLGSAFGLSLNAEQKERMERNRMLAAERRKARLSAMEQSIVRSESENTETTLSENVLSKQNSFNKLLGSSENSEQSHLENSHDCSESLQSPGLSYDNSDKLGLDDLMNLVDEEDPVLEGMSPSKKAQSVSDNLNEITTFSPEDAENLNFDSILKNTKNKLILSSEKSPEESSNIESSLDLICKTSVISNINDNADYLVNAASIRDENVAMKSVDYTSMDCENENSEVCDSNIKETNKFLSGDTENFKNFEDVNTENKIPSLLENFSEKNLNLESSLDLISETFVGSKINSNASCSMNNTSTCDENVIMKNEDMISMDYED